MANSGSKFTSRVQHNRLLHWLERLKEYTRRRAEVSIQAALDNISRENDRLRKELYDLQQRIKILTERLGFEDLDRAEESLNDKLSGVTRNINSLNQLVQEQAARVEEQQLTEGLKSDLARRKQTILDAQAESEQDREALGRLKLELQSEWQKSSKLEFQISTYRKENERLISECEELKSALTKGRIQRLSLAPETPLRDPSAKIDIRRRPGPICSEDIGSLPADAQVAHLRRQYDELLSSKERLAEKYGKDLAQWNMFKEKYRVSSGGKGIVVSERGIKTQSRVAKWAKDSPTPAARTSHSRAIPATPVGNDVLQLNPPSSGPVTPEGVTPATSNTETQDSRSVSPVVPTNEHSTKERFPGAKSTGQKPAARPGIMTIKQGSQSDNEARSMSSPAESPHHPKDGARRLKLLGKRKAFAFDGESSDEDPATPRANRGMSALASEPADQSRDERDAQLRGLRRKSGPQAVTDYQQFKGRGRYAVTSKPGDKTINSEFEINPIHNEGVAFQFDSVVRDKNERKKLTAGDCIACKEYYEAVGAMPARPGAPLWKSPPPEGAGPSLRPHSCKHREGGADLSVSDDVDMEDDVGLAAHKQAISRHRHKWVPASTPPDYWNIGFPIRSKLKKLTDVLANCTIRNALPSNKKRDEKEADTGNGHNSRLWVLEIHQLTGGSEEGSAKRME
ncbi:DNA repair protein endonuclease SAE2/CtIP C-terminus [Rhizoctonia solani]|uniref:DNA repair protein endonuclease SAE2/CtIP C-terminus n=1 Tax=Rhizoctonia solani TaxID=456999 RepID=A0A8H7II74_9AGAM|nr:DNA repair protein endonuclease SAE2/CtIP C-terminus [Rhizoctonia solani]